MPAGSYLAGRTGIALAFILAMIVFVPLFRVPAETDPAGDAGGCRCGGVEAFGKNEQVMKVISIEDKQGRIHFIIRLSHIDPETGAILSEETKYKSTEQGATKKNLTHS